MATKITFNLLLILLIELPIVAYFFRKKKRQVAVFVALLANIVTWIVSTILFQNNPDTNMLPIKIGGAIFETLVYWFFLGRNWKKAILMSLIANTASYLATTFIQLPDGFLQKAPPGNNIIR